MEQSLGFMFIGRSGCGKGTQIKLLKEFLEKRDGKDSVCLTYSGEGLRELSSGKGYTEELTREIMESGNLVPAFLAVWAWGNKLIANMKPDKHIIMDGSPRKLAEAMMIDNMMEFYNIKKVYPVLLNVSATWARARMLGRGRADDNEEDINERLAYYEKEVVPVINYFSTGDGESKNNIIEINGEQSVDEVHNEILQKIFSL